jgi:hypothetical protein
MIQTENRKESFTTDNKMGIHQPEQATGVNTVTKDNEKEKGRSKVGGDLISLKFKYSLTHKLS